MTKGPPYKNLNPLHRLNVRTVLRPPSTFTDVGVYETLGCRVFVSILLGERGFCVEVFVFEGAMFVVGVRFHGNTKEVPTFIKTG